MRCRLARAAGVIRHFRLSFGKRGVWAYVIDDERGSVVDAVVIPIDQS